MLFDLVQPDPVISQVKLIAEPGDIGEGGYQVTWVDWDLDQPSETSSTSRQPVQLRS